MRFTRRSLLKCTIAAGAAIPLPFIARAAAPEFTYKFGVDLPASHPTSIWAQKAADRIRAETGNRLDIQVFPNSQLGSTTDMISQLRSGALEFSAQSGPAMSTLIPAASLNSIGFAFKTEGDVWTAMDGDLGAYVRSQIEKSNLVAMDTMWGHGFRHMTSGVGPIKAPTDLRGLKIRVPAGPIFVSLFKALNASTATINFNELYSSLQTKVVDAQENPLALIVSAKLYEVQKYVSLTGHMWAGYWFLANRRAFGALPPELQATVARVVNESAKEQRAELARQEDSYVRELTSNGVTINEVDTAPFRDVLSRSGYYREWQEKFGAEAWSRLEKYAGPLS
jgi:tripartite ATP-independent transporter DctP family solute receptor